MDAADSPDTDALFAATPILRSQLLHLQTTLARHMNPPSLLLKPFCAALRTQGTQKTFVNAVQHIFHKHLLDSHVDNPISSPTRTKTPVPQKAQEADDRCFQVSLARRLMLAHPAANNPDQHLAHVPKRWRCQKGMRQLHCMICKSRGGVDQRHSTLATCLADLITTHTATKVYIEQTIPSLPRITEPGAQPGGARYGRCACFARQHVSS